MKLQLILLFLSASLIGCATTKTDVRNEAEAAKYDPATTARIRLITGEGTVGGYVIGQSCETFYNKSARTLPRNQSGWIDAHVHTPGLYPWRESDTRNLVIGIPPTKASKSINDTKLQFDEYAVPAGKPLIVYLGSWSSAVSCTPKPIVFTPEPGRDYEFQLEMVKLGTFRGGCMIGARKLTALGAATVELPLMPDLCLRGAGDIYRTVTLQEQLEQIHQATQKNP